MIYNIVVWFLFVVSLGYAQKHGDCQSISESPHENAAFVVADDGKAGVEFSGYIIYRIGQKNTFLPLRLMRVETKSQMGQVTTLVLRLDCAIVEIDLEIESGEGEYKGRSTEVRVSFGPAQLIKTQSKFVEFSRQIVSLEPNYNCSWQSLIEEPGYCHSKALLHLDKFGFILETEKILELRRERKENHIGYKCNF